jgi:GNAT superfamily N-acetyltransferase
MKKLQIDLDESPSADDFRIVLDGVRKFNREKTGDDRPHSVACFLRDDGRIVGGVQGSLWGRSMHIDALWIDEPHRGEGYGSQLMKAIEEHAAAQEHPLVYLETTSFQALPFYRKLGYEVFGELPEISPGHKLFFLQKELTRERG